MKEISSSKDESGSGKKRKHLKDDDNEIEAKVFKQDVNMKKSTNQKFNVDKVQNKYRFEIDNSCDKAWKPPLT